MSQVSLEEFKRQKHIRQQTKKKLNPKHALGIPNLFTWWIVNKWHLGRNLSTGGQKLCQTQFWLIKTTYAAHRRKPLSVQYVRFYILTDGKQGYRYYGLLVFYVGKWRRAPLKYNQTRRADGIIHVCMLKKIVSSKTIKRKHPILKWTKQRTK